MAVRSWCAALRREAQAAPPSLRVRSAQREGATQPFSVSAPREMGGSMGQWRRVGVLGRAIARGVWEDDSFLLACLRVLCVWDDRPSTVVCTSVAVSGRQPNVMAEPAPCPSAPRPCCCFYPASAQCPPWTCHCTLGSPHLLRVPPLRLLLVWLDPVPPGVLAVQLLALWLVT